MSVNGKAAGGFYSEEAARLAEDAAKRQQQPAAPALRVADPAPSYIPPILLDEPQRPPLAPEPAINQNSQPPRTEPVLERGVRPARPVRLYAEEPERRPLTPARIVAWVVLLPWYLAALAGAVGILWLFAKGLLHL